MSPLFISSVIGIALTAVALGQVTPSMIQQITTKKMEVSVIREDALMQQILRYRSAEGAYPASMTDLQTKGYWRAADNTNGFGGSYTFAIDATKGTVKIDTVISDAIKRAQYINNFKHSFKPVDAGSNVVSTTFILPNPSFGSGFVPSNVITSNTAPDPATNSYWYDTSSGSAVLKVSNGTAWIALAYNAPSGGGTTEPTPEPPALPTPILDVVTNAKVAFSTARQLRSGQTAPFRASKGDGSYVAEQDILFKDGVVDENALLTFIGSNTNAKIKTWYDQTGGLEHAAAVDNFAGAGAIYRSSTGGLIKENGKLTNRFKIDGSDVYYTGMGDGEFASPSAEYTIFLVGKPLNNTAQISGTSAANGGANTIVRLGTGTHIVAEAGGYDLTSSGTSTFSLLTAYKRAGDREIRINGVPQSTAVTVSTRNSGINRIGGSPFFAAPNHHDGFISEIIIYERALTNTEIETVENDIQSFYGITPPAPTPDPVPQYVTALMHFDGTNGSTNWTEPNMAKILELSTLSDAALNTSISKFGTSSLRLGGYAIGNANKFAFGGDDFTVESWVYPTGRSLIIDNRPDSQTGAYFLLSISDQGAVGHYVNTTETKSADGVVNFNAWNHIAYSRTSGTGRIAVNGVIVRSLVDNTIYQAGRARFNLAAFAAPAWPTVYFDEYRITQGAPNSGAARYTTNYTVPSTAFANP